MKDSRFSVYLFLLGFSSLLSSCGFLFNSLYGIKKVKVVDEKSILDAGEKLMIPMESSFLLDSTYSVFIKKSYAADFRVQINNHLQPLQALYFDENENLVSYHVNCYAGGFPNLNWNRNKAMEVFPPLQQAPLDSLVSLELIRNNINLLIGNNKTDSAIYTNTVVVFWNRFMGRQTKRFIKTLQENLKLSKAGKARVIYVNNDNLFWNF